MHIRTLNTCLKFDVCKCVYVRVWVSVRLTRQVRLNSICIQRRSSRLPKRGRSCCCGKKTRFVFEVQISTRGGMVVIFMPVRELVICDLVISMCSSNHLKDWRFTNSPVVWRELSVNLGMPVYFEPEYPYGKSHKSDFRYLSFILIFVSSRLVVHVLLQGGQV